MSGTLKIAGTTLATNPTNSKVEIDDAVSGKGICKAWAKFNGTLTGQLVGSDRHFNTTVGFYETFNVDYIIDYGVGHYHVHFENPMSNANYVVVGTTGYTTDLGTAGFFAANRDGGTGSQVAPSTTGVRVNSVDRDGSAIDVLHINVAIIGS